MQVGGLVKGDSEYGENHRVAVIYCQLCFRSIFDLVITISNISSMSVCVQFMFGLRPDYESFVVIYAIRK
jgi:hypothetical protein